MKTCFKCGKGKAMDEFYSHKGMGDGKLGKCKDCTKMDVKKHREEKLERVREYDRRRGKLEHRLAAAREYQKTEKGKIAHTKAVKTQRTKNPDKYKARNAVSNAIRDGRIQKGPCSVCGFKIVEAHHEDYSRPLDVVWLCKKHHREAHCIACDNELNRNPLAKAVSSCIHF